MKRERERERRIRGLERELIEQSRFQSESSKKQTNKQKNKKQT
jgi:hypothetical protein